MKRHLTQADFDTIPPCPPDKRRIEYCDNGGTPGLYLEVRATSQTVGTAYLRYKNSAGKTAHQKLGTTQEITLKQAREKARQLKAEIALGADPQARLRQVKAVPTWDRFFEDDYLSHAKQKKRTWRNDVQLHTSRLTARFGSLRLDRIERRELERFHNELRDEGLAASTCDHFLKLVRHALNLAVDWELIESNPAAKIRLFNEDNQRERYLTDEELKRLMGVLKTYSNFPMTRLVTWLLSTGARSCEARAATWADVDYDHRVWVIQSQTSKSKKRRSVPLNDIAISVLDELKAGRPNPSGPLFVSRRGQGYRHLNKNWARLCKAADLQGLRLHDLRHSYASMLVNAGHSLFEVQQVLGHSDPKVTMRYSHLTKDTLQKAADSAAERIRAAME